jgi:hypothetical protein
MSAKDYAPPLDKLLTYGDCNKLPREWPNYIEEVGLTAEHIPDLIRMATDRTLGYVEMDDPTLWVSTHALRALGQLQAEAAVEPLIHLFSQLYDDDDWPRETIYTTLGMVGAPAITPLAAYLADPSHGTWNRICATSCFREIFKHHPETREACLAVLTQQLEQFNRNPSELNGFIVSALLDIEAVEAAPLMEKAFAARKVDIAVAGDWHDVQVELGLKSRDQVPQRRFNPFLGRLTADFAAAALPYEPQTTGFGKSAAEGKKSKSDKKKKKR